MFMGLEGARVLYEGAGRCVHGKCCPLSFFFFFPAQKEVMFLFIVICYLIYPVVVRDVF